MSETSINDSVHTASNSAENSSVFAQRSSAFKARIERYKQLEKAQEIRDNLLNIQVKIDALTQKLAQILSSYHVLRQALDSESGEPIVRPFNRDTFGDPQILLAAFHQQYVEHKHDVAQQKEFPLLTQEIERLARTLNEHTSIAWRKYISSLKVQWEVDQKLLDSLVHLDEERKKQAHYRTLVEQFASRSRLQPNTTKEFEAVIALHEQLCLQRDALKLDVPEEVNLFLKAVAGPQGATIDMLTEDVRTWLTEEDDLTRYRIKRL